MEIARGSINHLQNAYLPTNKYVLYLLGNQGAVNCFETVELLILGYTSRHRCKTIINHRKGCLRNHTIPNNGFCTENPRVIVVSLCVSRELNATDINDTQR